MAATHLVVQLLLGAVLLLSVLRPGQCAGSSVFEYEASAACRVHTASITDFGAVGDGKTSNTKAFHAAVAHLSQYSYAGGSLLFVPPGRWLTGPFNVTSYFTLFLHRDAVILASQDMSEWPIIPPLPSYGRGRDTAGGRFSNFIMGSNLTDVVITGDNGTIDGQGAMWWEKFHKKELTYTRGYLIELMFSGQILISNLTLVNSPSWNIHPVYSSDIVVKGVTIIAPVNSPNTDGINPDSCSHVKIEDCSIVSGDDCVAVKSGWDKYGVAFGMPSEHILIRRLSCVSPTSAVIALGSEMSGGIRDVRAEDITAVGSESGVRIKTAVGRGAYVKDVFVRGMKLHTMKYVFWMTGGYGSHPDNSFDPRAIPVVHGISYSGVVAENVTMAGKLEGIQSASFTGICISDVRMQVRPPTKKALPIWNCTNVEGVSSSVSPQPCSLLVNRAARCPYPADRLPVDYKDFRQCSYHRK